MAISAKTNQLTGPGATGSQAYTDPGFQPVALLTMSGSQTANGASADQQFQLGWSDSTAANEVTGTFNSDDNVASSDVVRGIQSSIIKTYAAGTTTNDLTATHTSMDATGFTFNWTVLATTSPLFNYLALGGSDITNSKSGSFAYGTTTGNLAVTGVGFQPDIVLFFTNGVTAVPQVSNASSPSAFGVMTSSAQWSLGVRARNAQATMDTGRAFSNTRCIILGSNTADSVIDEASYVSMDSDGFTVNRNVASGTDHQVMYLAIKGGTWAVGTETQKTSTGTKATTGLGITPSALILASVCDTQTSGTATNSRISMGFADGTNNNAVWAGDQDAAADSIANTIMSATKCIVLATEATAASPTTNAEASVSSFDSGGYTLNWSTADATARVFGYIAVGTPVGGGTVVKDIIGMGMIPFAR